MTCDFTSCSHSHSVAGSPVTQDPVCEGGGRVACRGFAEDQAPLGRTRHPLLKAVEGYFPAGPLLGGHAPAPDATRFQGEEGARGDPERRTPAVSARANVFSIRGNTNKGLIRGKARDPALALPAAHRQHTSLLERKRKRKKRRKERQEKQTPSC